VKEPPQHGSTGGQNGSTDTANANVTVKFVVNEKGTPPGKLADAELHFNDGVLAGLKLIGFSVWERQSGGGRNVTFPARQYSVNGERRSFALLRPIVDIAAQLARQQQLELLDVREENARLAARRPHHLARADFFGRMDVSLCVWCSSSAR
jgi:hypothetical protein